MPLSPEEVGARIVRAREEKTPKPWSQFDLALALGRSPSTVYRWEKGKLPQMSDMIELANVLGIPLEELTEPPERRIEMDGLREMLDTILHRLDGVEASLEERGQIVADSLDRVTTLLEHLTAEAQLDTGQAKAKD